jgi:hypothetical protein
MGTVTRTYQTDTTFVAEMIVSGFGISFHVPTARLARGAALNALKNEWLREALRYNGRILDEADLRTTARAATEKLRMMIEAYFDERSK